CLLLAVYVAEEGEIQRMRADRQSVDAQISNGFILEDQKTREMQRIELRERNQRVVWVHGPRRLIHGVEQATQFRLAGQNNRRQNHESSLRCHGLLVEYLITCGLVTGHIVHVMA